MKSNNALIVILGTVTLDAVGIGLVMPVLPGLLRDSLHACRSTLEDPHAPCSGALSAAGVVVTRSVTATLASALAPAPFAFFPSFLATFAGFPRQALNRGLPLGFRFSALRHLDPKKLD